MKSLAADLCQPESCFSLVCRVLVCLCRDYSRELMLSTHAHSCTSFVMCAWLHPLIATMHDEDITIWSSLTEIPPLCPDIPEAFGGSVCNWICLLFPPGPPGPPGVVIVEEITDTTATLSWTRGLDNHSPISTYNLQARSPFSLGWQTVKTGNQ